MSSWFISTFWQAADIRGTSRTYLWFKGAFLRKWEYQPWNDECSWNGVGDAILILYHVVKSLKLISRFHLRVIDLKWNAANWLNLSPSSAAYMRQWMGSTLFQIMACRLYGAKSLSKPMPGYCQLDPQEQTSVKLQANYKIFIHKNAYEMSSAKWRPSCPGRDEY